MFAYVNPQAEVLFIFHFYFFGQAVYMYTAQSKRFNCGGAHRHFFTATTEFPLYMNGVVGRVANVLSKSSVPSAENSNP